MSISNPKSKYVAYVFVLSQFSNCQGLGRKNKHDILKVDRIIMIIIIIIIIIVVVVSSGSGSGSSSSSSSRSSSSSSMFIMLIDMYAYNKYKCVARR